MIPIKKRNLFSTTRHNHVFRPVMPEQNSGSHQVKLVVQWGVEERSKQSYQSGAKKSAWKVWFYFYRRISLTDL